MSKTEKSVVTGGGSSKQQTNLSSLLKYFIGLEIAVELKNGRIYRGILHESDDHTMNIVLRNANTHTSDQICTEDRNYIDYSLLQIRGGMIRYIQFPDDADLPQLVKMGINRVKAASDKYNRGKRTTR
jgi:small nuclear ribonucleoprotein (snRNP)-like protein